MTIYAYRRVSKEELNLDNQTIAVERVHKVDKWYEDECSGTVKARQRPGLSLLLGIIQPKDTLIVYAIDRLGRSTSDTMATIEWLRNHKVRLVSLKEHIDLSDPMGEMIVTIFVAFAQAERARMAQRISDGIVRFRQQNGGGWAKGIKNPFNLQAIATWHSENGENVSATAREFKCSNKTVRRALHEVQKNDGK